MVIIAASQDYNRKVLHFNYIFQGDWRQAIQADDNGLVSGHAYTITEVLRVSLYLQTLLFLMLMINMI